MVIVRGLEGFDFRRNRLANDKITRQSKLSLTGL